MKINSRGTSLSVTPKSDADEEVTLYTYIPRNDDIKVSIEKEDKELAQLFSEVPFKNKIMRRLYRIESAKALASTRTNLDKDLKEISRLTKLSTERIMLKQKLELLEINLEELAHSLTELVIKKVQESYISDNDLSDFVNDYMQNKITGFTGFTDQEKEAILADIIKRKKVEQ